MSIAAGSLEIHVFFPFPWPPCDPAIVQSGRQDDGKFALIARTDGRLEFTNSDLAGNVISAVVSQPVTVLGIHRTHVVATWTLFECMLYLNGKALLTEQQSTQSFVIDLPKNPVPQERSFDDPNARSACQKWIQKRKSKFASIRSSQNDRRMKTLQEEADDLRNSATQMTHLLEQIDAGESYLLGSLSAQMRACVYWGKDSVPERNYNPLLLRMADKAELPLPVYSIPQAKLNLTGTLLPAPITSYNPDPARIWRRYHWDEVCDLQEALADTVLSVGDGPAARTIIAKELIAELAHTEGAHYDPDTSEFVDVLRSYTAFGLNHVTRFMCQTAATLVSLSEWVLSELKTRNPIG